VLGKYDLACVSGWYSGRLAHRSVEEEIASVGPHLRLLADSGATVMVYGEVADAIQGEAAPFIATPPLPVQQQWQEYADKVTAFAAHGWRTACAWRITTTWAPTWKPRRTWTC
jgi:inosose dehydratase